MSYEEAIKQQMQREAQGLGQKTEDEANEETYEDDSDDDDFDYSILGGPGDDFSTQPHVNGTESSRLSDEGMFED